jgi:hypothetical protein
MPTLIEADVPLPQQSIIRLLLDYKGVKYDVISKHLSPQMEMKFYSGELPRTKAYPQYKDGETKFCNVSAILRMLAIKHELYSKDTDKIWQIDAVTDLVLSLCRQNQKLSLSETVSGDNFITVLATVLENRLR